jgi:hypothetical protein
MFGTVSLLRDDHQTLLDEGWAGAFYRELFCRLDEQPFAVLYSEAASRPNMPVNVLVGLEVLKAGFGWSDSEMYEAFTFNLQVRYALGYRDVSEGYLDIRTVYYFRQRLAEHMQTTGKNLLAQAFAQITDAQIKTLAIKTGRLRMDSTFIASNICDMSRLHLLVAVLLRVYQMLTPADRTLLSTAKAQPISTCTASRVKRGRSTCSTSATSCCGCLTIWPQRTSTMRRTRC